MKLIALPTRAGDTLINPKCISHIYPYSDNKACCIVMTNGKVNDVNLPYEQLCGRLVEAGVDIE